MGSLIYREYLNYVVFNFLTPIIHCIFNYVSFFFWKETVFERLSNFIWPEKQCIHLNGMSCETLKADLKNTSLLKGQMLIGNSRSQNC